MKKQIRILGIDDAPFTFSDKYTRIVGVIMRGGSYLECVLSSKISVDGTDSTPVVHTMIQHTKHRDQLRAVMLDGIAFGGFNIVNIHELYERTDLPVLTVTRDKPDFQKMKKALRRTFADWKERFRLLEEKEIHEIPTKYNSIYVQCVGISLEAAKDIIKLSTIRGVLPEPIRVAHLIASGITRGESYGKA
jgi:hypothetical protein